MIVLTMSTTFARCLIDWAPWEPCKVWSCNMLIPFNPLKFERQHKTQILHNAKKETVLLPSLGQYSILAASACLQLTLVLMLFVSDMKAANALYFGMIWCSKVYNKLRLQWCASSPSQHLESTLLHIRAIWTQYHILQHERSQDNFVWQTKSGIAPA